MVYPTLFPVRDPLDRGPVLPMEDNYDVGICPLIFSVLPMSRREKMIQSELGLFD